MSKILIVEDETNLRNTLTDLLEMFDYEVVAGVDGEDGLEKALTENVDLILCDINMPKMDGFEMLENLTKKMQKEIIPPFIFLSAKIAREDIRRGMKLGATDYITKPFTNQEILDTIESKLDYRSQLQSNISDDVRERISIKLHDELQPYIVASKMGLDKLVKTAALLQAEKDILLNAISYVEQALDTSRAIARELVNKEEDVSISSFLNEVQGRITVSGDIKCNVELILESEIEKGQEQELILIIQELVTNILKHAEAKIVNISVVEEDEEIMMTIQDDGVGFEVDNVKKGLGMGNLDKRVQLLNGQSYMQSNKGKGTKTIIIFPVKKIEKVY